MELFQDNTFRIECTSSMEVVDNVHASNMYRQSIALWNLADLTPEELIIRNMMLKNGRSQSSKMVKFDVICNLLEQVYLRDLDNASEEDHKFIGRHTKHAAAVSITVRLFEFVHQSDFNYRIRCVMGETDLTPARNLCTWSKRLHDQLTGCEPPISNEDLQGLWTECANSCDLCLVDMEWFDFQFVCGDKKCGCSYPSTWGFGHMFCGSCMYSIMSSYCEVKPLVMRALSSILDNRCIEEIVYFCVGQVVIHRNVGVKRHLGSNDISDIIQPGHKRRRLC